jgi:hypothetical protein
MNIQNWQQLLRQWTQDIFVDDDFLSDQVPRDVIRSGWLGYPGATEAQLVATEHRLGVQLPPSYRTFLQTTNGWRQLTSYIYQIWPTEGVDWFAVKNQSLINIWINSYAHALPISDQDYFVYGEEQYAPRFRPRYLQSALEISECDDGTVYLLNPQVVTPAGEWEAWLLAPWLPGAHRYPSFWELMVSEHSSFINSRRS